VPNKITISGHKELIEALAQVSTRVGSALSAAIRDALKPVIPDMKAAVLAAVSGGDDSTNHWSVSDTDFKVRTRKNGTRVRTLSSAELIKAVKDDPRKAGGAKRQRQFLKDGTLAVVGNTGMLAKSISVKAKAKAAIKIDGKRVSQKAASGWVGPSNTEMVAVSRWTGKPQLVVPTRYAHLVNNPRTVVIRGRTYGKTKGRDFMGPIYRQHSRAISERVANRLQLEIAKAKAAVKKGR